MAFLYETHCHTAEVSPCGHVPAEQMVTIYKKGGYSGVVITDHFRSDSFEKDGVTLWKDKIDTYLKGYKLAKTFESDTFKVFLGMELRFPQNDDDFLIYGLTEDFLYANANFNKTSLSEFRQLATANGLLIFQAHPFRNDQTIVDPTLLDGIEIYNGNQRHDSRNSIANIWAQLLRLRTVSGSDFHELEDACRGGVYVGERIADADNMTKVLKKGNCTCKVVRDQIVR